MQKIFNPQWINNSRCKDLLLKKATLPALLLLFGLVNLAYGNDKFHLTTFIGNGSMHMVATAIDNEFKSKDKHKLMELFLAAEHQIIDADDIDIKETMNVLDKIPKKKFVIYKASLKSSSEIRTFGHPTNMAFTDSPSKMFYFTYQKLLNILPQKTKIESLTVAMSGYDTFKNQPVPGSSKQKLPFFTEDFASQLNIDSKNVFFIGGDQEILNIMCQLAQRKKTSLTPKPILFFQLTTCLCVYTYPTSNNQELPSKEGLKHVVMNKYNPKRKDKDGGTYQIGTKLCQGASWLLYSQNSDIRNTTRFNTCELTKLMPILASKLDYTNKSVNLTSIERKNYAVLLAFSNYLLQLELKNNGIINRSLITKEGQSKTLDFTKITPLNVSAASEEFLKIFHGDPSKNCLRLNVAGTLCLALQNHKTFEEYNNVDIHFGDSETKTIRFKDIWNDESKELFDTACKYCIKDSEDDVIKVISGAINDLVSSDNCDVYVIMDVDRAIQSDANNEFKQRIQKCAKNKEGDSIVINFIEEKDFSAYLTYAGYLEHPDLSKKANISDPDSEIEQVIPDLKSETNREQHLKPTTTSFSNMNIVEDSNIDTF